MIDYALILSKKYPDSLWRMNGDDYEGLEWLSDDEKPTKEELESQWDELKKQAELQRVENNRRNAYRNEADPLFLKWQRNQATEQEWLDKIAEIKERFPKPE